MPEPSDTAGAIRQSFDAIAEAYARLYSYELERKPYAFEHESRRIYLLASAR
jgi:hypothetical protein